MSQTKASATRTVRFIPQLGTYAIDLIPSSGELWQNYTGNATSPAQVVPDYKALQPIVELYITSSRVEEGSYVPPKVEFYLGTELIGSCAKVGGVYNPTYATFNNNTESYGKYFTILPPGGQRTQFGIQIKDNLVALLGGVSTTLKAVATIEEGTASDTLTASTPIKMQQSVGTMSKVVIEAADSYNFQITNANRSTGCELVAKVYGDTGEDVTTVYRYEWYVQDLTATNGWKVISSQTNKSLKVTEGMVEASTMFMVIVKNASGEEVGRDTQFVVDATDPLVVKIEETPVGGIIRSPQDQITYKPSLVYRDSGLNYVPLPGNKVEWIYTILDPVESELTNPKTFEDGGEAVVGYDEVSQCDGLAIVVFQANEVSA